MTNAEPNVDVSVCIVAHNGWDDLQRAVASAQRSRGVAIEVIVIDNASSDGTPERLGREFPDVRQLQNGRNTGYAPAMNRAIAAARGRYVLALSQDAEVEEDAILALSLFIDRHETVGIVGPRTADGRGGTVTSLHNPSLLLSVWTEIVPVRRWIRSSGWVRRILTLAAPNSSGLTANYEVTRPVPMVDGGCLMVSRQLLDRIGGLDPMLPQGPDDYDLCHRARAAGFDVWYVAEARAVHRTTPKESIHALPPRYLRLRLPQLCFLYAKQHKGWRVLFFRLSAWLLARKLAWSVRRQEGPGSSKERALCEAAFLCLRTSSYVRYLSNISASL